MELLGLHRTLIAGAVAVVVALLASQATLRVALLD
jgi:hypothetical protein